MDRSHLARSVKSGNSDAQHVFTRSRQAANQPESESDTDSEVNKDLADEEYNPNESRNKSKETPGEFVGYGSVLSKKTRERVANVSPSGSACSFLGTPYEDHVVDGMHLLRRKTDREYLHHLAKEWRFPASMNINTDTRYNIMFARTDIHRKADGGHSILLPESDVLDKMVAYASMPADTRPYFRDAEAFPAEGVTWNYSFVPLTDQWKGHQLVLEDELISTEDGPDATSSSFVRSDSHMDAAVQTPSRFSVMKYPFEDFPLIRSHVHPFFVVMNGGEKLFKASCSDDIGYMNAIPSSGSFPSRIRLVEWLFRLWASPKWKRDLTKGMIPSDLYIGPEALQRILPRGTVNVPPESPLASRSTVSGFVELQPFEGDVPPFNLPQNSSGSSLKRGPPSSPEASGRSYKSSRLSEYVDDDDVFSGI